MLVSQKIYELVYRLKHADIPLDSLCYMLDELDWREFMNYCEQFAQYKGRDLSYAESVMYLGLEVRKRS